MTDTTLRLRRLVADNLAVIALAVLLVTGAGVVVTYGAYTGDRTTTESSETTLYETESAFAHGATVARENEVFPLGTRLSDRSQYYTRIAPVADGNYSFGYRAESGRLDVDLSATLVVRGVATESSEVLWTQRRPLDAGSTTGLSPGETATVDYRVNVTRLTDRTTAITESLGGTAGEVQTFVRVQSRFDGMVAGSRVEQTTTDRLAISTGSGTYSLTPNTTTTAPTIEETVEIEDPPGPLRAIGGPLLLAAGLIGVSALAFARVRGKLSLSSHERDLLAYRAARDEYDDWITIGTLPAGVGDTPGEHVVVDELEGLVDVAIDTDGRVIENAATGQLLVETPRRTYRYDPPTADGGTGDEPLEPAIRRID
ncbi:hypothetical protein BRD16_09705 [Halobacteriales archaeon SW_6_65_46]|nr:MAG: hypothetical protein BRD16_09705 [Halobacteriales archaeon SW_6_65_46]